MGNSTQKSPRITGQRLVSSESVIIKVDDNCVIHKGIQPGWGYLHSIVAVVYVHGLSSHSILDLRLYFMEYRGRWVL